MAILTTDEMKCKKFLSLPARNKKDFFEKAAEILGLPAESIEKDWWVTLTLKTVFELPYGKEIQFKGGTSLSKSWNLIERFSEDIDLALSNKLLGFPEKLTKNQISGNLRKASKSFILDTLLCDIEKRLNKFCMPGNELIYETNRNDIPTQDPIQIYIKYPSVYEQEEYISHRIMLEISGRSNNVSISERKVESFLDSALPQNPFKQKSVTTLSVNPERTFIEKICLLHEEFNQNKRPIRHERMSRHLYDLYMMAEHGIDEISLNDETLFKSIIQHRFLYNRIDGVDYNTENPGRFNIIPPEGIIGLYEKDYDNTMTKMIYSTQKPTFKQIIEKICSLNNNINNLNWAESLDMTSKNNQKDTQNPQR